MTRHDDDNLSPNVLATEHFQEIVVRVAADPARRRLLKAGSGVAALAGWLGLTGTSAVAGALAKGGPGAMPVTMPDAAFAADAVLGFPAVPQSLADHVVLPPGYVAKVLHATGDPIQPGVTAYSNAGLERDDWSARIGDHHDGMEIFYIDVSGRYAPGPTGRAVLVVNHESSADAHFFHPQGQTSNGVSGKRFTQFGDWDGGVRPGLEVLKEINQHGFSVVELEFDAFGVVKGYRLESKFNRRVTPHTGMQIQGPAKQLAAMQRYMRTRFDPSGATVRGTLNNCGHGKTPWGTYLGCEENWATYFNIPEGMPAVRGIQAVANRRYGLPVEPMQAQSGQVRSQGWFTVTDLPDEHARFARWNLAPAGKTAEADFRNEGNTFGYVVEFDPLDPASVPAKRVALGRLAHEAAVCSLPREGEPLAFYMGCDAVNEYIYKFVTAQTWNPGDVGAGMVAGNKYLNEGRLYVARFNDDGQGEWIELTIDDPRIRDYPGYPFASQADILVNTRLAADAVGATRMDRPEWGAVNPRNGDVYMTLTNNNARQRYPGAVDAANPRAYQDSDGKQRAGNPNGHIIRFREAGNSGMNDAGISVDRSRDQTGDRLNLAGSTRFTWDVFLFGSEPDAAASINLSALTATNWFSSPDGLWFSPSTGVLWIQTDDGAATDLSNCMMLAAVPGEVGDGGSVEVHNTIGANSSRQTTRVGQILGEERLKRFLVGPRGCEITGLTETADGRCLLVNIQHPGEKTKTLGQAPQFDFQSQWPAKAPGTQQYGPGERPRSATLIISRIDGVVIGMP